MRLVISLALILLILPSIAAAETILVDVSGSDTPTCGDFSAPCQHIEYSVEQRTVPGDVVSINDGTYYENQIAVPDGVSITSTSSDRDKVIIEAAADMGTWTPLIKIGDSNMGLDGNIIISHITLDGDGANDNGKRARFGIQAMSRNNVQIYDVTLRDFYGVYGSQCLEVRPYEIIYYNEHMTGDYWPADSGPYDDDTNVLAKWPTMPPVENFELSYSNLINCGWREGCDTKDCIYPSSPAPRAYFSNAITARHLKDSSFHHNRFILGKVGGQAIVATPAYLWNVDIYDNYIDMVPFPSWCNTSGRSCSSYPIELWAMVDCDFYNNVANAGFSIAQTKRMNVFNNTINFPNGGAGRGLETDGSSFTDIHHNYLDFNGGFHQGITTGSGGGGPENLIMTGISVHNNIIKDLGADGIITNAGGAYASKSHSVRDVNIYNNIIINAGYEAIRLSIGTGAGGFTSYARNVEIHNNMILSSTSFPAGCVVIDSTEPSSYNISHNLYFDNTYNKFVLDIGDGGTLHHCNSNNPEIIENGRIITDPLFISSSPETYHDYALQSTSPAIDAGVDVGLPFAGSVPDIGAIEYGLGSCTPDWSCSDTDCSACVSDQMTCTEVCTDLNGCSPDTQTQVTRSCIPPPTGDPNSVFTRSGIVLDGLPTEPDWGRPTPVTLDRFTMEDYWPSSSPVPDSQDASLSARSLWDDEYLYFLLDVSDDILITDSPIRDLWRDDGVEIYIEGTKNTISEYTDQDNNIMFSLDARIRDAKSKGWNYTIQVANSTTASGYALEISIPWTTIGVIPSEDHEMGIAYQLNDDDGIDPDISLFWRNPGDFNTDTNAFRNMSLVIHHRADDTAPYGCIEEHELIPFIDLWKYDSTANPMWEVMEAVTMYYGPETWC